MNLHMRWYLSIALVLSLLLPNQVVSQETVDHCNSPDRTIYLSIFVSNGYEFGSSESSILDGTCTQFELINYDHTEGENKTHTHYFDMLESENPGIPDVHRLFPTDGSHKSITIFIPQGLNNITIFCGDEDHRLQGLNITFPVYQTPPTFTNATSSSSSSTFTYIFTSERVIIPGFSFLTVIPVVFGLLCLSKHRKPALSR